MLMRDQPEDIIIPLLNYGVSIAHWAVEYNRKNFYVKSALKSTEILLLNKFFYVRFLQNFQKNLKKP